jgi:glucokinase
VDEAGTILARDERPTPADDQVATLDTMVASARSVMRDEVVVAGVAAAGLIEAGTGILRSAPNLAWRDAPLIEHVGSGLGVPVVADNDNNAAAWGEFRFGAGRGYRHLLFVGVGTGIGGGVVIDGTLFRGAHGFAAEIGHFVVEPDGPACGCGNRGCFEQVASGSTITRYGRRAVTRHPYSDLVQRSGGDPGAVTGAMVTEAARAGDTPARGILVEVGHRLGEGIAGLVNILDPELVIVGGGASAAGDLLLAPARTSFGRTVEDAERRPAVPIVAAALGIDAGAIGAASLGFESL